MRPAVFLHHSHTAGARVQACPAWHSSLTAAQSRALESIQRRAMRIIVRFAHELRFATSWICRVFMSCQSELSIKLDLSCDWDYFKLIVCRPSDNANVLPCAFFVLWDRPVAVSPGHVCSWGVYKYYRPKNCQSCECCERCKLWKRVRASRVDACTRGGLVPRLVLYSSGVRYFSTSKLFYNNFVNCCKDQTWPSLALKGHCWCWPSVRSIALRLTYKPIDVYQCQGKYLIVFGEAGILLDCIIDRYGR